MNDRINQFQSYLSDYSPDEVQRITQAALWADELHAGQERALGEAYIIHLLGTASTLIELKMDSNSVIAALLHDSLITTTIKAKELEERFGSDVLMMVDGISKMSDLSSKNQTKPEAESIRKMLFAMVKDIRVILIKLAEKLDDMRTLAYLPEERRKLVAQDCLDIYAPLAARLGISWIKDELEDLSLKHLNRDAYDQIKGLVALKKNERSDFLKRVQDALYQEAAAANIEIIVSSRVKHFYSIYQKMRKRSKGQDELYDLLGIRMLCEKIDDCYTLLGIVHKLWKPIDGRFKDYIAMPKSNGYQSLHTTVICLDGTPIEIQIRTQAMHQVAEYGIASHWFYKLGRGAGRINQTDISLVNRLKSWNIFSGENDAQQSRLDELAFLEDIKRDLLKDSIYVFTPKGNVIELPVGATPIDFAYQIHSAIGDHCFAAKANGAIIPLTSELKNTQIVEIITSQQAHPNLNWLHAVKTAKARSKIRAWLIQNDDSLIIDKNVVAKKKAPSSPAEAPTSPDVTHKEPAYTQTLQRSADLPASSLQVRVEDESNFMIHFARCCSPITGEPIIGYVSRGRGIIVHQRNCRNLKLIPDFQERKIDVEWELGSSGVISRFRVEARRTTDLFSEIEGAIRKYQGHLLEGRLDLSDSKRLSGFFTMEIENTADLKKAFKSLRAIPAVIAVQMIQD